MQPKRYFGGPTILIELSPNDMENLKRDAERNQLPPEDYARQIIEMVYVERRSQARVKQQMAYAYTDRKCGDFDDDQFR